VPLQDNQGEVTPGALPAVSRLHGTLSRGGFAVTADLAPPRGADPTPLLRSLPALEGRVDALNLTENQGARVRACGLAACALVLRHSSLEPVMQVVCRGRNRLALQSELLGAALLGVRNLLVLRGDPPVLGDHPEALDLLDLDVPDLLRAARGMCEEGRLVSGAGLDSKPSFFLGAVIDTDPRREEEELPRARLKMEAGARFFQTQPVFDAETFSRWMEEARPYLEGACLLAGVLVAGDARAVRRLEGRLPGIRPASGLAERLEKAGDPAGEGARAAAETVAALREIPGVRGVHLMAAGRREMLGRVLELAFPPPGGD